MKKIHIIVFLIFFLITTNYCQVDSLKSFFPLQVGNYWQYQVMHVNSFDTTYSYTFAAVLKDTVIGSQSNSYYAIKAAFSGKPFSPEDTIKYIRYDSLLCSIVEYDDWQGEESIFFKLDAVENDCWDYFGIEVCSAGIDTSSVFGVDKQSKEYHTADYSSPPFWVYKLARDFGPIKIIDDQSWGFTVYSVYNLVYAKINGVEYGILSVDDSKNLPKNYSVLQNYPNPFNPSTTIKYQLPEISFVIIKVYDVLGKEIATLVNEEKPAGSYEVDFNGEGLTSGIYFYQLQAGNYVETKKMVLLK